ncbi:MAG: N-acetylmuramoyl-L-alanine amidase [Prevotella sp.]|nr:N-acetylmuramoyl-L-alanine amidase [Prevotella sp.]
MNIRRFLCLLVSLLLCLVVTAASGKRFTLVIDAGHGGRDAGCVGKISKEKDLTLRYALAFGKMVERNCPDVKVIYTRKTDVFLELWQRAEIANRNKADLFVSVHINALPGKRKAYGVQTYTLGRGETTGKRGIQENLEVAKRENSVILLEKDYKTTYHGFDPNSPESSIMFEFIQDNNMEHSVELAKMMQRNICSATGRQNAGAHQNNLAVLRLTSMPGCLLELGFISTPDEERFLNASSSTELYARGIYNAFVAYKNKYHKGGTASKPVAVKSEQEPVNEKAGEVVTKTRVQEPVAVESVTKPIEQEPVVAEPVAKLVEQSVANDGLPVFKVQILCSSVRLKAGDKRLKGHTDADFYEEGGLVKYTCGASTDYNEIYRLRKQLVESFPEAFIIAFRNGTKMDVRAAIQEFKSRRNRSK